ncbi:HET domain-containing protein [Pyrenophora tritici-repentis]|nr:HET domain-containing protein [Pyrenophora tritici-repentis]KAI1682638.1 HET domain-containing protein [Pyrenophora tritici-repentis]
MPLLYGEGPKAFLRLQQEIMKQTDDQTLFAWKIGFEAMKDDICRPLASHPSKFRGAGSLIPTRDSGLQSPFSMTNKGLRIEIPVIHWDDGISEDTLYGDIHVFPPGHRRGAVLMQGDDRSHLLVFFNAEMENLRGYACKILYSPLLEPHFLDIPNPYPRTLEPSTSRIYEDDITPSQKLVQDLANTVLSALEREDDALSPDFQGLQAQQVFANEVDRSLSWNLMHDHYGPSNTEYDITECHMDFSAYAHIGPNKENGISIIIVKINFKEVCELQGSLYELEGSPAPIIKNKY